MGAKGRASGKSAAPKKPAAVSKGARAAQGKQLAKIAARTATKQNNRQHKSAAARKRALLEAAAPLDGDFEVGR